MIFEYMLYVFILIGFIMGFIRGWKQEIFAFLSMIISSLASILLYDVIKGVLGSVIDLNVIYEVPVIKGIFNIFGFTYYTFEYLICGGTIFIISFLFLSILFNSLFFRNTKKMDKRIDDEVNNDKTSPKKTSSFNRGNRFVGGLIGLLTGLFLGLALLLPLSTLNSSINVSGFLTNIILSLPLIGDKLMQFLNMCGVVL